MLSSMVWVLGIKLESWGDQVVGLDGKCPSLLTHFTGLHLKFIFVFEAGSQVAQAGLADNFNFPDFLSPPPPPKHLGHTS